MTVQTEFNELQFINRLSAYAAEMGYEIVDLAGFLDLVEAQANEQLAAVSVLGASAASVAEANAEVRTATDALTQSTKDAARDVTASADTIRSLGVQTTDVASWVKDLGERAKTISGTLNDVNSNNAQIASIAMQVNILAINAKIEAARAGDAGRGFAVVADAINDLSKKTRSAATRITNNIETLTGWISHLGKEAQGVAATATDVIEMTGQSDTALSQIETSIKASVDQARTIASRTRHVSDAITNFGPNLSGIETSVSLTTENIKATHARIFKLIDTSERIVQASAALGGTTADAPFIDYVREAAARTSARLQDAIATGRITTQQMFDQNYKPVSGSDPAQVTTAYTDLMDQIMPDIQEPALEFDPKVVFCAAVDVNGYLSTHNRKFSQAQGPDPVWNMANCRNRRIFDDRVGLKAGRNTDPFLLQVYRRDMGGGTFTMMKDLSAPIVINGQHWGGLRFAYTF